VRTFVPVVAGVAGMSYRQFAVFNIAGGVGWVASMTLGGYFLGSIFPDLGKHIEKVIIVIVALSILPMVIEFVRAKRRPKALADER
jgi:membrane-associated protein